MEGFLATASVVAVVVGMAMVVVLVSAGLTGERGSDRIGSLLSMGRAFKVIFRFSSKRLTNSGLSMIDGVVVSSDCCRCLTKVTEVSGSLVICDVVKLNSWVFLLKNRNRV